MTKREKALEFATRKHEGQKRKDGKDYITHPIAVAEIALQIFNAEYSSNDEVENELVRDIIYILSILHDVYEDTDTTYEELVDVFGESIADSVVALSRKEGQTYYDFIMNVKWMSPLEVRIVKLADLEHNMSDLNEGSLKDKYRLAKHVLTYNI